MARMRLEVVSHLESLTPCGTSLSSPPPGGAVGADGVEHSHGALAVVKRRLNNRFSPRACRSSTAGVVDALVAQ